MKRVISETRVPVKIWATDLEPEAEQQLRDVASLPFVHRHVAVMPDAHHGKGSTVGTVIATRGAIIPAAIGVDIGCGMCAVRLPFKVDLIERLPELRSALEAAIPVGHLGNTTRQDGVSARLQGLGDLSGATADKINFQRAIDQMGSLGGGNHFIEICQDLEGQAWVMLHSGSRNIGKTLADIHITEAQGIMKKAFIEVPNKDLSYLWQGSEEFLHYMHDLHWAQGYAKENRAEMMDRALRVIARHVLKTDKAPAAMTTFRVDCHHNYCQKEHHFGENLWVTRKGAVSAKAGEYGIIPGSMGAKSFIVRGLGNPESFHSCSHGAGRKMSRTRAKLAFNLSDLQEQTRGVECRKDADVLDEIPGAYKDIVEVMANQADLVEPVYELKQILCIKG